MPVTIRPPVSFSMHRIRARVWDIQVPSKDCGGAWRLEQRRRCAAGVATRRVAREGRYAVYKWTYMDGYASARRRENQPSEWGYIKRYNRRLFKRMCPYESGFAPPLYARAYTHRTLNISRAKRQNTGSSFYRVPPHQVSPCLFILFPQSLSFFLSFSLPQSLFHLQGLMQLTIRDRNFQFPPTFQLD